MRRPRRLAGSYRRPQEVEFRVDGFTGMRDQRSPQYAEGEMLAIFDMWPEMAERPSRLSMRPGFKRFSNSGDALQLTAAGDLPRAHLVNPFGFTYQLLLVQDSEVWLVDLSSVTVTKMLSAADLAGASVAVGTNPYIVKFNGKVVFASGGVADQPFTWDGTASGGITKLTSVAAGSASPTVRAGKLFFIKPDAKTIIWSEELQENVGYDTGGYNNAWDLTKINPQNVAAILGDETGLYVFRQQGVTLIVGEVNQNFETTSTRDAIDETQGVSGVVRPVSVNGVVLFADGAQRPVAYVPGRGIVHLWKQMPRLWAPPAGVWFTEQEPYDFPLTPQEIPYHAGDSFATRWWYDKDRDAYCYAQGLSTTFIGPRLYWFAADTFRLISVWRPAGAASSTAFFPCAHGFSGEFNAVFKVDPDGYCFVTAASSANTNDFVDETFDGVQTQVVGTIMGPPHGWNQRDLLRFYEALVLIEHRPDVELKMSYVTSQKHKGTMVPAAQTYTADEASTPFEGRVRFVLDELARWMRPQIQVRVSANSLHGQTGIYGYLLRARVEPTIEAQ